MTPRGWIESFRRLSLVVGVAAGSALTFMTGFAPYVTVQMPRVTPDAEAPTARAAPVDAETTAPLIAPGTRRERERERESAARLGVPGPAWQTLFAQAQASFSANLPVAGWEHRIPARELAEALRENPRRAAFTEKDRQEEAERVARLKSQYHMDVSFTGSFRRLYFQAAEAPFATIAATLGAHRRTILTCSDCPGAHPLQVEWHPAPKISGFFDVITVPQAFAFPHRPMAWWPPLLALAIYLLLPWGRVPADTLAYARWRVMLGDVVGLLLFGVMVFLPFGIIGGTLEALLGYPWLVALFWLLAALGLVALAWNAWAASYRLQIGKDSLRIATATGVRELAMADLIAVDPMILRPPKWLIMLSWMAVFLGGNRIQRLGQTGRAMLLSASGVNGLRLRHRDGSNAYLWYSDQLGQTSMPHYQTLEQGLKSAGLDWSTTKPEILRAIFPPSH